MPAETVALPLDALHTPPRLPVVVSVMESPSHSAVAPLIVPESKTGNTSIVLVAIA